MKLVVRATALLAVFLLVNYGTNCSRPFSSVDDLGSLSAFSCVSDESTLQNLTLSELKVGYLGNQKITYKPRPDGYIVVDGDILIKTDGDLPETFDPKFVSRGVGVRYQGGSTWPSGVIPYRISSNLPNAQRVIDAINHWNSNLQGIVQFVERTTQTDYAYFVPVQSGCAATVGYQQGRGAHPVEISNDCGSGNVAHEMGHIVGLDHEQNRFDRDSFVTINFASIMAGFETNFQVTPGNTNYGQYDFGSIMHYGLFAFSKDGTKTITPRVALAPQIFVGQRAGLSIGDINTVRTMYGGVPIPIVTDPNGQPQTPAGSNLHVQNGLLARVFADQNFTDLKAQRIEPNLDYNWMGAAPQPLASAGTFSVRWTGYLIPPVAGDYSFQVKATDNVLLRISDTEVIRLEGDNMAKESVSINYTLNPQQRYIIIVDYAKHMLGESRLNISWRRPGGVLETIPSSAFIPDANDSIRAPCSSSW